MNEFISKLEISDCISLLGVILTGVFSCLIWRTTKKIGKRQNELQESQHKIELNKTYRELYACLQKIYKVCATFFYYVETGISSIVNENERNYFQLGIEKLENAKKEYEEHKIDIELQLSEYSMLTTNIDYLLMLIDTVYCSIRDIQIIEKTNMLNTMIKTINKEIPGYYLNGETELKNITDNDCKQVLYDVSKIISNSVWTLSDYENCSDEKCIKHVCDLLSKITDNLNIENNCRSYVKQRDKIFFDLKILDHVKEKCSLK